MNYPCVIDLLRQLVRMDSRDPPGREIAIARHVCERLGQAGIEAELDEFVPGRANVLARVKGRGERPAIVFSAHFDTVPLGKEVWTHDPFGAEIVDGRLYGRGAADMKSGMAAMIVAAEKLSSGSGQLAGDLVLAFTAGESSNCIGARRLAETRVLEGAGALLVSEPSSMDVLLAEMGALWLRLIAHGRSGHLSGGNRDASSAIERMMDALAALRTLEFGTEPHPILGPPTMAVGRIEGGTVVNLTPDRCEAEIDVRTLPEMEPGTIEAFLLERLGEDLDLERIDYKPPVETPADHPFARICLEAVSAANRDVAVPGGASYYSDATVLSPAFGLPMVIIGPGTLGMSGQTDEHVMTRDVKKASALYRRIALAWFDA